MSQLKLIALDDQDLMVISAVVQDGVMKIHDLDYDRQNQQFFLIINRFSWEKQVRKGSKIYERRRCHIAFKRVESVKFRGINREQDEAVLSLLAIQFHPKGEGPGGEIELVMSANAGILLDVECIEVQLTDTVGAWETQFKPHHRHEI